MTLTKIGASLGGGADTVFITQAGHGLTLGYPVKANGNGTYAHATADTAANAEAIGIIIESTTDTMRIALSGRVTVDGCVPNLSAGTVLFLQVSAGLLAAAEPSVANQVSKPMAVITYANSEMILLAHRGEVISSGAATLADGSVDNDAMADDAIGADELAANAVVNASVASGAAIAFSKMENLTNSRLLVSDGSGDVSVSAVTAAEILQLSGLSANVTDTNLNALTAGSGDTSLHSHAAGGPTEASQANMETEATGTLYAPPDLLKHSPGVAKAYCVVLAAGSVQTGDYGVSTIGDTAPGNRDVNWSISFDDTNYTVSGCIASTGASVNHMLVGARAADKVNVFTRTAHAGSLDDEEHTVIAFGKQV